MGPALVLVVGVLDGQDTVKSSGKSLTKKKSKKVASPTKHVQSSGGK